MKTRVAKAIARTAIITIIWSLALALVASVLVYVFFRIISDDSGWLSPFVLPMYLAFSVALVGGLVIWPLYMHLRITIVGAPKIVNKAMNIVLWTLPLTLWGGVAVFSIGGAFFAFASSVITFGLYELSTRVRFFRKQQDKIHHLVHHMMKISKKKGIALIGLSALLLGMIPVFVILDPVGFRNNAAEDNDIVTVMEECGTPPLTLKQADPLEATFDLGGTPETYSDYEHWVLHDADNQVIGGWLKYYTSQGDIYGMAYEVFAGCLDASARESVGRAFSEVPG